MARKRVFEKSEVTRRKLLNAALEVIARKGYSAATVDEIVKTADVSKGVAYYHFKSKAEMATSVLEDGMGDLIEGFEETAASGASTHDVLTTMIGMFATKLFENQDFARFFLSELWRENREWSETMRNLEVRLIDVIRGQILRAQEEGTVRPSVDPDFTAVALVGMVLTTSMYYLAGTDVATPGTGVVPALEQIPEGIELPKAETIAELKERFIAEVVDFVHHALVVQP